MKKLLLLPAFLVLVACKRDCPAPTPKPAPTPTHIPTPAPIPTPTPTPPPAVVPVASVPATFSIYDAIFLNQFNTAISVNVFYFEESYPRSAIIDLFGGLKTLTPIPPDTTWIIRHVVGVDGFDADPGSFTRQLRAGKQVMLTWSYPESGPKADKRFAKDGHYFGLVPANKPVKFGITIDRGLADL